MYRSCKLCVVATYNYVYPGTITHLADCVTVTMHHKVWKESLHCELQINAVIGSTFPLQLNCLLLLDDLQIMQCDVCCIATNDF